MARIGPDSNGASPGNAVLAQKIPDRIDLQEPIGQLFRLVKYIVDVITHCCYRCGMDTYSSIMGLVMFVMLLIVCGGVLLVAGIVLALVCRINLGAVLGLATLGLSILFPPLLVVSLIILLFAAIFGPSRKQANLARAAQREAKGQRGLSNTTDEERAVGWDAYREIVRKREDEELRQYQLRQARKGAPIF